MVKKSKQSASVIGDRQYDSTRIRDADGKLRTSRGNGDAVAKAMLIHKASGGKLDEIIKVNDLGDRMKPHRDKQEGLRRMTLGVMLRALVRNGTSVKIGRHRIEKLSQKIDLPKVEELGNGGAKKPARAANKAKRAKSPSLRKRAPKVPAPNEVQDHEGIAV